ncbi:MAG: carbon-nitrogen hydrolase family protein [Desulfuromonadales bacterium]
MSKLAVVQKAPAFLNKEQSISIAVNSIQEAAEQGAALIIFTETFIPGYPAWIWRLRPGVDWNVNEELFRRLVHNSITVENDIKPLCEAAQKNNVTVVCGIEERDGQLSRSTLYNSVIVIGPDGQLMNRHRKLMPTNPERMVWGFGDASGLKVVTTPVGRISTLLCWENFMPLARYALYSQGVEIYIAPTYDSGDNWICSLQHIAREGRCWVVGCGNLMRANNLPDDYPEKQTMYPDPEEWINPGDSIVISPDGEIATGPLRKEEGILYCDIDLEAVAAARRALDVAGHYSRPDIFTLHVNNKPQSPVKFSD